TTLFRSYVVSLMSGLTDVDAITLSLANSARTELSEDVAIRGIFLAALSNSLGKAALIGLIGGRAMALLKLPCMAAGLLAGYAIRLPDVQTTDPTEALLPPRPPAQAEKTA